MSDTIESKGNLKWWILFTVIIGTFLGRLDQTIVGLALPKIMNDFGITITSAAWITTAYIIANAVFVPIWGKLGDILGRKKIYILGFSIFIVGSVLCALAWNLQSMVVFRIIQAIAGSADYPTAMAIIAITFKEGKERAQALGIWSSSFAAAAVFGPLIGGPLIDNFSWQSVFMINLPVGIIGLIMALIFIHESKSEEKERPAFDWVGALVLGISLASLVLVLDKGIDWGWMSLKSWIAYVVTAVATGVFILIEKRHKAPIVDLKFFKNKNFVTGLVNNFVIFMGMMGCVYLIPIFAQTFLGFNATKTGQLFIPMAAAMMIAAPLGGSLTGKFKPKYIIFVSSIFASIGIYLFSFVEAKSGVLDIIIPLSIMAFGMGFGMAQRTAVISNSVPKEEIGSASSVLALTRNIAGAFGIALFGTILTSAMKTHAIDLSHSTTINTLTPSIFREVVGLITLQAQILSYRTVFTWSAIIVFCGSFLSLFINPPIRKMAKEDEIFIE